MGGCVLSMRPCAPRAMRLESVGSWSRQRSNTSAGAAESRPTMKSFENAMRRAPVSIGHGGGPQSRSDGGGGLAATFEGDERSRRSVNLPPAAPERERRGRPRRRAPALLFPRRARDQAARVAHVAADLLASEDRKSVVEGKSVLSRRQSR